MSGEHPLELLLDLMIPGDADFPEPSSLLLADAMIAHERFGPFAEAMLARMPDEFAALDAAAARKAVEAIERGEPAVFDAFITGLYSLYYVHPAVLEAVEHVSGYAARPPQPLGYELAPFDPAIVAVPAARGRQYREAE